MAEPLATAPAYRSARLPGLGRVEVPAHLTDAEVLAEIAAADGEATPKKKSKKKP